MATNWYSDVIDVLNNEHKDFRALVIEIAKRHPKAVVMADRAINGPPWQEKCRRLCSEGKKIEAVKLCRNSTGMGLKEAKEAVEGL